MTDGATWAAFGMAILSLIGTIFANINARAVARDKMEFERQATRDKMEFDTKLLELQNELGNCREQHRQSEMDRAELRKELDALRDELTTLQKSSGGTPHQH